MTYITCHTSNAIIHPEFMDGHNFLFRKFDFVKKILGIRTSVPKLLNYIIFI